MSTIKEWYQIIINEKQTLSSLDVYTPNPETTSQFIDALKVQSSVAIWRLSAWLWAFMAFILEGKWDTMRIGLQAIQDATPPHTRSWWTDAILAYQDGDTTVVDDNGKVSYDVIDEDKKIVKLASIENVDGVWNATEADATINSVRIYPAKVTGVNGFGNDIYAKLSGAEADGLRDYVNDIKPLGIKTEVLENNVGTVQFLGVVYYDPKLVTYGGNLISDPNVNPYFDALQNWLHEDVNKKGVINKSRFISAIIEAEGVSDFTLSSLNWSASSNGIYVVTGRNLAIDGVAIQFDTFGVGLNWIPEDRI